MLRITIIGKSRTGTALARAIRDSDRYELVQHVAARTSRVRSTNAEVLIIAVKDDWIREVSERALAWAPEARLMIHLAGSLPPDALPRIPGMDRMMLHPIQTFAKRTATPFDRISWAACSTSSSALRWAKTFIRSIGSARLLTLRSEDLATYHAISVFAANMPVLLGVAIEELGASIGLTAKDTKQAVAPLVEQVLHNLISAPASDVLSGPIRRGDIETIERHRQALKRLDPALWEIYDAFLGYASKKRLLGETDRSTVTSERKANSGLLSRASSKR